MRFSERKRLLRKKCVFSVCPLTDARWDELVTQHLRAGVFYASSWLSVPRGAYGYDAIVFATCGPREPLSLVFCKVRSWMTGRWLVSSPISDHSDLLADSAAEQADLLAHVCEYVARDGCVQLPTYSCRKPFACTRCRWMDPSISYSATCTETASSPKSGGRKKKT
jgi:hypothetical protein